MTFVVILPPACDAAASLPAQKSRESAVCNTWMGTVVRLSTRRPRGSISLILQLPKVQVSYQWAVLDEAGVDHQELSAPTRPENAVIGRHCSEVEKGQHREPVGGEDVQVVLRTSADEVVGRHAAGGRTHLEAMSAMA